MKKKLSAKILYSLYAINHSRLRTFVLKLTNKIEKGEFYSSTLRKIFRDYHEIQIGMYTHGGCFRVGNIDRHTSIGRYCSIATTARVFNRNHPLEFESTHAFFFNPKLNFCDTDLIEYTPLEIGNDVWLGHNSIIMPNVKSIGDGAVVAAGAVINKNIPPYAVAVGNPARIVRYRFSKEVIEHLLESKWWEKTIEEIKPIIHEFRQPYEASNKLGA